MRLNPGPHYWIVTSVLADSSLLFAHCCYSPNTLHTTPMCGTEHIRCVSLHCRDQRGAATLRYRNRAEIIIYYLWTEALSGIYGCGIAIEIPMILQDPRKPTSAETSLKKWICVPSIFIDIIPAHLRTLLNWRVRLYLTSEWALTIAIKIERTGIQILSKVFAAVAVGSQGPYSQLVT